MFKQFKFAFVTAAVLVGGVAGIAAAEGRPDHKVMKEKFDLNKDGKLDDAERAKMKEAREAMRAANKQAMITKFDANRNGTLEPAERAAMKDERAALRFKQLDTNGDGQLSLAEFKAAKQRHGRGGPGHHRDGGRGNRGGGPGNGRGPR